MLMFLYMFAKRRNGHTTILFVYPLHRISFVQLTKYFNYLNTMSVVVLVGALEQRVCWYTSRTVEGLSVHHAETSPNYADKLDHGSGLVEGSSRTCPKSYYCYAFWKSNQNNHSDGIIIIDQGIFIVDLYLALFLVVLVFYLNMIFIIFSLKIIIKHVKIFLANYKF